MFLANKLAGSGAAAKTYVDDVFATTLYTGGVSSPVVNGIDLAGGGGLTIFKARTEEIGTGTPNRTSLLDTHRGSFALFMTDSSAQSNFSGAFTSFNNNGFTLGVAGSGLNCNTIPYVNYTFRKASKFFDVVSYTGDNQIRTISHSLGSTPGMMILKRYSGASASWVIYHRSLTATSWTGVAYSGINTTASIWNNTEPTITGFTIGNNQHNTTGESNIAYLFGHDTSSDGLIFCDQFTTDASGLATVIIGWEPQFLWAKEKNNSGADGGWIMLDIQRGWSLSNDAKISPSSTAVETSVDHGNPTSDGFVFKGAASAGYIYMAVRRSNKPPTSGSQVFRLGVHGSGAGGNVFDNGIGNAAVENIDMLMAGFRQGEARNFMVVDKVRGIGKTTADTKHLVTSSTAAETATGALVAEANIAGYKTYYSIMPVAGQALVEYGFKRAPGFFDVVAWSGTSAAEGGRAVPHNLGVAPELIIHTCRNVALQSLNWVVRFKRIANPADITMMNLNLSAGDGGNYAGSRVIGTSTGFDEYMACGAAVNSAKSFVSYLFATLPGISKVGTYTGNGSAMTINCGFATGARFVMIKRTDASGDWCVFDTVRGITDEYTNDPVILMNSTSAETNTVSQLKPNAVGFNIYQDAANNLNVLNATYIFLAIA